MPALEEEMLHVRNTIMETFKEIQQLIKIPYLHIKSGLLLGFEIGIR